MVILALFTVFSNATPPFEVKKTTQDEHSFKLHGTSIWDILFLLFY